MKSVSVLILALTLLFTIGCNKENNVTDVRVTTYTPQDITQTTAKCGGDVIATQGLTLNELGVCWSTSRNPTVEDAHLSTSNWNEPYVCTIAGLEPGTSYHVRAYALRGLEYYYGEDKSFTTEDNGGGGLNNHDYIDLGLPSGTLWATCNVGSTTPEGYGDYFAWGENQPKEIYNWNTYKYSNGDYNKLTKYCDCADYGYNGFTDNLTTLQPSDDAAMANWDCWRMPTKEQWQELLNNTTSIWTTRNGAKGWLFTASNGGILFLPAAGYRWDGELNDVGCNGEYWSSSLFTNRPDAARGLGFNSGDCGMYGYRRGYGFSVRPVRSAQNSYRAKTAEKL